METPDDNCLMCLSNNLCSDEIRKVCNGRFLLDKGLSYYYQVVIK